MEITIWGVLTGAILPLFGYLAFHWLALSREARSRLAHASNDFRATIVKATSQLPPSNKHWNNETLRQLPGILEEISVATEVFKYFKRDSERKKLLETFESLDKLVKSEVPEALSAANVMYSGGQTTPEQTKAKFWKKIGELQSHAIET